MCPLPEPHTGTFFLNLFYCYLKCHFHLAGISGDGSSSFFQTFYHTFGSNRSYFLIGSFPFHRRFGCDRLFATFSVVFLPFFTVTLRLVIACSFFSATFFFWTVTFTVAFAPFAEVTVTVALPAFLPLIVSFPFLTDTFATLELLLFADLILSPLIAVVLILIAVVDCFT